MPLNRFKDSLWHIYDFKKKCKFWLYKEIYRSSPQQALLGKGFLKIYKWQSNFIEIAVRHGGCTVNFLHILRTPFPKNTSEGLLLNIFCNISALTLFRSGGERVAGETAPPTLHVFCLFFFCLFVCFFDENVFLINMVLSSFHLNLVLFNAVSEMRIQVFRIRIIWIIIISSKIVTQTYKIYSKILKNSEKKDNNKSRLKAIYYFHTKLYHRFLKKWLICLFQYRYLRGVTVQKMKFSIKNFFSRFLRIWSHLLKKSFMENFIFCAVGNYLSSQDQWVIVFHLKTSQKHDLNMQNQSSEVFCKKGVLRNFAKFTGKRLCQSLFYNKVAGL